MRDDLTEIARRADMVTARLFISPDPQPNAFATGRNKSAASLLTKSPTFATRTS